MLKNLLPVELLDDAAGNLAEIRIGKETFNRYSGNVSVPDGVNVREVRKKETECVSRKFILHLKEDSAPRTGWLKIRIPYGFPLRNLAVWAADARFPLGNWRFVGLQLFYSFGTVIPAVTLFDRKRDIGLTVCKAFGRTGGLLSFAFGLFPEDGMTIEFSGLALEPGKDVEIELLMCGHRGCWRPGLDWIMHRYPEYFEPVNPEVWKHHGAFAITNPFTKPEVLDRLPVRWSELHNHFPCYGNYAPEEPEWESVVLHDYPELKAEIPGKISRDRINSMIARLHEHNIKAMLYIQVNGDCFMPMALKCFPDSIARDSAGDPYPAWKECCLVNASESTTFGRYISGMIDRFLAAYPDIDGVFLDQLCYQMTDYAHSDGKTSADDRPAAEYGVSYDWNLAKLSRLVHGAGKFIWANGPFDIEVGHLTDGVMSEGTSGISEAHKYLCLKKPHLIHTYPNDEFKAESMLQYCLLAGSAWSYGGSSTLQDPPDFTPEIRRLFDSYLPLIKPLLSAEILLEANPFLLPPSCKGEIFRSKENGEILLTLIAGTGVSVLPVTIGLPHGKTAKYRGNSDTGWNELAFEGDVLNIPNRSRAYLIRFASPENNRDTV